MVFGHKDEDAAAGTHKPTIGEKIGGAVDSLVGKATHKPEKVAEGETKKTGNPIAGEAAGREQAIKEQERREDRHDNDHSLGHNNNSSAYGHDNSLGHDNNSSLGHNNGVNPTYIPAAQQNVAGLNNAGVVEHDRTNLSSTTGGAYGQSGYDDDHHNRPSTGEKISGGMQSMVGKATHNPEKVAEGEAKKTHDPMYAQQEASEVRRDNINRDTTHQDGSYGNNQYGTTQTSTLGGGYVGETAHQPPGAFNQSHTGAYDNSVGGNHAGGAYGQGGGAYDHDGRDKPGMGEKLSGGMSSMIGKATHNPGKVADGEYKKTHDSTHAQQEAREVRHDNLEREGGAYGHNQTGGVYGQQNQAGGAYTTNPVGGNQQTGAYGSVNPTGGVYDGTNTGNRY